MGDSGSMDKHLTPIGFGAFKIGRNEGVSYSAPYVVPAPEKAGYILNGALDLGITLIDTAPAYGISEIMIGHYLADRRKEYILSTKVGEAFERGESSHDFSRQAVEESLEKSLRRMKTDHLDIVLVHAPHNDLLAIKGTDAVETLMKAKEKGDVGAIGLSGYTQAAFEAAMEWADCLMVEYNIKSPENLGVIQKAKEKGLTVLVKKGLARGALPPEASISFVLDSGADCLVVGSLNLQHLKQNLELAQKNRPPE